MKWSFAKSYTQYPKKLLRGDVALSSNEAGQQQTTKQNILPHQLGHFLILLCVIALWFTSLAAVDLDAMTDLGFITILPFSTYAALALLTLSFGILVSQRAAPTYLLLSHIVILIFIVHGTPSVLYGTHRYSWVWKHLGIVDYIQRHGSVNPNIPFMSAYHNWPGFFTLNALINDITGIKSSLNFAIWSPVFFNLLNLGALLLIFKAFSNDQRLVWLAIWFFYLTNWVGQDYFSPQALNYFLHLVFLGICLNWFEVKSPPSTTAIKRWLVFNRVVNLFHAFLTRATSNNPVTSETRSFQQNGLLIIALLIFSVIASSHQITPFMTISAVTALVIFQRCSVRSLPLLLIVITETWIVFGARAFMSGAIEDLISSVGQVTDSLDSNLIDVSQVSTGQSIVAFVGRALTLAVLLLAILGGMRRLRQGHWDLSAALLAVAPFAMLAGNSYGGEILFRVYLFAIPFLAFFAAALIYPSLVVHTTWWTTVTTIVLSWTLLTSFLFPYYGKERQYYFTPDEVEAAQYLYNIAPQGTLLIDVTRNYPWQFQNYEFFTPVSIAWEPRDTRQEILEDPVKVLSEWMSNPRYSDAYLFLTRSQKAEINAMGELPYGSVNKIEQALLHSREFEVVYENKDARIFRLAKHLRRITQNELAAAQYLQATATQGSLIIDGTPSYRERIQTDNRYTYMTLGRESTLLQRVVFENPVEILAGWMKDPQYTDAYVIITRSQKAEFDSQGTLPTGALDDIEQALLRSNKLRVVYENEDARIFTLVQHSLD